MSIADAPTATTINLNQTPIGSSGRWSLERILCLNPSEALRIWRDLPAPTLAEMNGHYLGLQPTVEPNGNRDLLDEESGPGAWLGKAFRPISATKGEGYNRFRRPDGSVVRESRMATYVGTSPVDGRPSYLLDYSVFDPSIRLVDDLRKLDDWIYLGVATIDKGDGSRRAPAPFFLVGPTDSWVGPDAG